MSRWLLVLLAACVTVSGCGGSGQGEPDPAERATSDPASISVAQPGEVPELTGALAALVADMNQAQVDLVIALRSADAHESNIATLQQTLAARALAVGRLADLLAAATGVADGEAAAAGADMYRNIATVAYAQAYFVARPSTADIATADGRAEALDRVLMLRQALWTGAPNDALPEDTGSASFSIDAGEQAPVALVTMSLDRIVLDISGVEADASAQNASADALARASDPANQTPLTELASIAATRLMLHAEPAPGVSRRALSAGLTFEVARRSIISSGIKQAQSDALRTFFALADENDLVSVFSLLKENDGEEATESSVSRMVYSAAARIFSGSRGIINDTELLARVILDRGGGSAPYTARDAALAQRVIFDAHLIAEEPSFVLQEATFDGSMIGITVSYTLTGGDLIVNCRLSTGDVQSRVAERGDRSASFRFPGSHKPPVGYACWSLYGTFAQGELGETAAPPAAEGEGTRVSELCPDLKFEEDRLIPPEKIEEALAMCDAVRELGDEFDPFAAFDE